VEQNLNPFFKIAETLSKTAIKSKFLINFFDKFFSQADLNQL